VCEDFGNLPGRHRSSVEVHRDQNAPACRVSERGEHSLVGVAPVVGVDFGHGINLAQMLNVVNTSGRLAVSVSDEWLSSEV
jgi:hypothetical protein